MFEVANRTGQTTFEDQEQELVMELTKFQRQYRIMENDRKTYRVETLNLIKKQGKQIEELAKERSELQMQLQLARSDQYISKDMSHFLSLQELLKDMDNYRQEMTKEKEKIRMIDEEYASVLSDLDEEWKKLGGKQAGQDLKIGLIKKIRRMENNLDNSMKDFNNAIADNNQKKKLIFHMLQVREHFNGLYEKLLKHLELTKIEMKETVSHASQAFDQREECQAKIQSLKDRWEKDDNQYQLELKDLHRGLEHDQILKRFMQKKTRDRDLIIDMPPSRRLADKGKSGAKDKVTNIEFYRKAFNKIASLTGEANIDVLVDHIKKTEESNFALFNYVNDLNGEIEHLHEEIQHLTLEIDEVQTKEKERESQRQNIIKQLETKLEIQVQQLSEAMDKLQTAKKTYESLENGISQLFEQTKAIQYLPRELADENKISNKNIIAYVGAIEQRAILLMSIYSYLKAKMEREAMSPRSARAAQHMQPPMQPVPAVAQPTVTHDILAPSILFDETMVHIEEEETRVNPMTSAELKGLITQEKAAKSLKMTINPVHSGKQKEHGDKKKLSRN